MPIAYSQDLRQRALDLLNSGVPLTSVSRLLNISRPTLYTWLHKFQTTGSTAPSTPCPPPQVSNIKDWQKFKEFVERNGDKTQQEMSELWGQGSRHTISRGLKKLGITRKKKPIPT